MTSPLAGEFLGTMILVLLGDGVVAAVLLKRSKAEGSGWMVITAGWAFAVMAGVFTAIACGSSGDHRLRDARWQFCQVCALPRSADAGGPGGRRARMAALPSALEGDA